MKATAVARTDVGGSRVRKVSLLVPVKKNIRKHKQEYSSYLYRAIKQVHPDMCRCRWAADPGNRDLVGSDCFSLVAAEAARLSLYNTRNAITSREVQTALKLLYTGGRAVPTVGASNPCC
ncbi:histone H2B-like [Ascaphus truei]|uniref:histone H2B-like n=1 Tax=Ascaphus truei TaxID=8439 RepID=UPI003F5A072D